MAVTYNEVAPGIMEVRGRTPIAWYWKIQPWWWLYNSDEPTPPAWYKSDSSKLVRTVFWYLRNFAQNFGRYVIGVADRNYDVHGQSPVNATDMRDLGLTGWKWSVIHIGWMRLPYVSYTGRRILWHIGWEPMGNHAIKFNVLGLGESPL